MTEVMAKRPQTTDWAHSVAEAQPTAGAVTEPPMPLSVSPVEDSG